MMLMLVFVAALSYAFVGHAGASAYLGLGVLAGLSPVEAKGQALLLNLLVASLSAFFFTRAVSMRKRLLAWLLLGSVPAALLGSALGPSPAVFKALVALALAAAALRVTLPVPAGVPKPLPSASKLVLLGAGLGLLSGLTGVGGGVYLSPILLLCAWAEARETAALAACFILVNSLAGLGGLLAQGQAPSLDPAWAAAAVMGGCLGAWAGSRAGALDLRRALAGLSALAALKLVL